MADAAFASAAWLAAVRGETAKLSCEMAFLHRAIIKNIDLGKPEMPVWKPPPVSRLSLIPLSRWRIFELTDGSRYFVGVDMFDQTGRVSSPIVAFNAVRLQGTTQTGRIYELVGKPGVALQADYVWRKWCELYEVTSYKDVTQRLLNGANDDNAL